MKALLCKQHGLPETLVVEEVPDLEPGPNEAVIEVRATAVNFPDVLIIQNLYQYKPDLPFSPGGEAAGVVVKVGEKVKNVKPGDRVIAMTGHGAFAQQLKAPAMALMPMVPDLDYVTGSAIAMTYGTSLHALKDRARLKEGETLLVLGASGGVGLAAIEIGKAMGAKVIAAASTTEKLAVCKEHGADEVINYNDEDLKQRIRDLTDGKGADVIYDPVGGDFTETAFRSIAWRGRHLVIGFANGEIPKIPINLMLLKGAALVGVFWGNFAQREPMNLMMDMRQILGWLADGTIKPHIAGEFSLADGPKAIRQLMDRKVSGKVVILPQQ